MLQQLFAVFSDESYAEAHRLSSHLKGVSKISEPQSGILGHITTHLHQLLKQVFVSLRRENKEESRAGIGVRERRIFRDRVLFDQDAYVRSASAEGIEDSTAWNTAILPGLHAPPVHWRSLECERAILKSNVRVELLR